MKVFCPNCGTSNEGMPGGRLTCQACTASFEVPREGKVTEVLPPVTFPPPGEGPMRTSFSFSRVGFGSIKSVNTLAVMSLVLSLLCCIPFASTAALVIGIIAQRQIKATGGRQQGKELALAGTILGGLGALAGLSWVLSQILK